MMSPAGGNYNSGMRFTKGLRLRLCDAFYAKMSELAFDDDRPVSTWSEYLAGIGCRRVSMSVTPRAPRGHLLIEDPIWYGDGILVPRPVAERALFVGLP